MVRQKFIFERFPSTSLKLFVLTNSPDVAKGFSYSELCTATRNFSEENNIGHGNFGEVFRGLLSGQEVAVKKPKSNAICSGTEGVALWKDYITEVKTLGELHHKNLVKLVGWCDGGSNDKLLLVYELVKNKSLDKHLHDADRLLTWPDRYRIVLDIGRGIEYLHTGRPKVTLHRDIKPSNVMLNDKFEAKLGDFGLVRQVKSGENYFSDTPMIGSWNYIDPVCITTQKASTASDMYSFGVLLLEVATGKKPAAVVCDNRVQSNALIDTVSDSYDRGTVLDLADQRLKGEFHHKQMERVLAVGLLCVRGNRRDRLGIREAIDLLSNISRPLPQTVDGGMAALAEG